SVVESKVEIVTLHLCCDARGCVADPSAKRRKFVLPELSKPGVGRCETNRPAQIFPIAGEARFPFPQFRLRFGDVVAARLIYLLVDLSEIERMAGRQLWRLQNSRACASGKLHEVARLHETQKGGPVLLA